MQHRPGSKLRLCSGESVVLPQTEGLWKGFELLERRDVVLALLIEAMKIVGEHGLEILQVLRLSFNRTFLIRPPLY